MLRKFAAFWLVFPIFACRPEKAVTAVDPVIAPAPKPVVLEKKSEDPILSPEEATCHALGGTSKKLLDDSGATAFCKLGRSLIGQATLHAYHSGSARPRIVEIFLAHPRFTGKPSKKLQIMAMGNPSRLYCLRAGGKVVDMEGEIGLIGVCAMLDGSMMAAWTLFNGPENSRELTVALDGGTREIHGDLAVAPTPES